MNLEFLKQLVDIDSRTQQVDGVNQIQTILYETLTSLDFDVKLIKKNQDKTGDLLWAQRKGISPRAITLVCHADTVIGPTDDFKFKIDFEAARIYGPGIGDNKGGIALLIGSVKDYLEKYKNPFFTINIVCSPSEETGSIGFHEIFKEIGEQSDYVFGFEPALNNGDIINERSGNRWYNIKLKGKSGHAGRWNDPTINIAHVASDFISKIHHLSSFEKKRRINVASMQGGIDKYNVICEDMEIKIDTRFKDFDSLHFLHNEIVNNLNSTQVFDNVNKIQSSFEYQIIDDCPPMGLSEVSKDLSDVIVEKIKMFEGKKIQASFSGGAADVNYFQRPGLISVDGLGPIASKMHTKEEFIEIESFYSRRHVFTEILIDINQQNIEDYDGYSINQ